MKRIGALILAVTLCGLLVPSHSDGRAISISPRVAVPVGDFGDLVSTGFGGAVALDKEVKGKPGRVGLVFLTFPEGDFSSATAFGAFAGYKYMFGSSAFRLFGKFDTTLYRISTETDFGFGKLETDETKIKLSPGIGVQKDAISVEVDYDLAGDWMGINLYYTLGGE